MANRIGREIEDYINDWGLMSDRPEGSTDHFNGGDSLTDTCAYGISLYYLGRKAKAEWLWYRVIKPQLVHRSGLLVRRSPNMANWTRDWDRGTWDQWQNCIYLAGLVGDKGFLVLNFIGFTVRAGFCTNVYKRNIFKDPMEHAEKSPRYKVWPTAWYRRWSIPDWRPGYIFHFLRSFGLTLCPLWPILVLSDMGLVIGALLMIRSTNRKVIAGDDKNFIVKLEIGRRRMYTPTISLARWIYHNYRDECHEEYKALEYETKLPPLQALRWQYRFESYNAPIDLVLKPLIEEDLCPTLIKKVGLGYDKFKKWCRRVLRI